MALTVGDNNEIRQYDAETVIMQLARAVIGIMDEHLLFGTYAITARQARML